MKEKKKKFRFIPVLTALFTLAATFTLAYFIISSNIDGFLTVGNDSAYDNASGSGYRFIESEEKNGIKYYVISKESAGTTSASASTFKTTRKTTTATESTTAGTSYDIVTQTTSRPSSATASTKATTAATTVRRTNSDEKIAYLTFDDGPSINTEKLLDILDKYDVKATFFVIYHRNMESKYKAIVDRGHTIALHSYTHTYSKIYRTEEGYYDDLNKIHDYVEKVTGVDSNILRFPGGSSNTVSRKYNRNIMKTLKKSVTDNGYVFHDWNIDSTDASGINRDPDILVENVEEGLKRNKPVVNILMHDTGKSKMTTVEALPRIIEAVKAAGYRIEPLSSDSVAIQHTW